MQGNARKVINESMSSLQTCVDSLQQSLDSVEKQENKDKIQQAIVSLNSARDQLSKRLEVRNGIE